MSLMLTIYFSAATTIHKLPPGLLDSVCYIESSYNVDAVHHDDGNSDSLGVCQVKLKTAKWLGFTGDKRMLMNPQTNIEYAAKYLEYQLQRYDTLPRAVSAYNRGNARNIDKTVYSSKVLSYYDSKTRNPQCSENPGHRRLCRLHVPIINITKKKYSHYKENQ